MNDPKNRRAGGLRRATALAVGLPLILGSMTAVPATAAPAGPTVTQQTQQTQQIQPLKKVDPKDYPAGRYIVVLNGEPAATYDGGVPGIAATKPAKGEKLTAKKDFPEYKKHLEQKQRAVAAEEGVEINRTYTAALNGFSAKLTSEQAVELAKDPEVRFVAPDVENAPDNYSSMDFLNLTGEDGAWATQFGGVAEAGAGTVVGVIDTGYTPGNPFFAGNKVKKLKKNEQPKVGVPYLTKDGNIAMLKADGTTFEGACQKGEKFSGNECNSKVLAAQYFAEDFIEFTAEENRAPEEVLSPVDIDSHGTHTASTAAGNSNVTQTVDGRDFGTSSGVAPAAKLSIYKTCWADDNPNTGGCYSSAAVAAINQAILDGVDVLNYSISGSTTTTTDPVSLAFLSATSAGIFVATSAGNSGPTASTVNHGAPWLTTVAASTFSHALQGTAEFSDGSKFRGASIMNAAVPASPVVLSANAAAAGATDPGLCAPDSLDPALVTGKVVVCDRGVYDRVAKSAEVARAGGVGMILANMQDSSTDADKHSVPTVHVNAPESLALKAKVAAKPDIRVALVPEDTTGEPLPPVPQIAGFSSRGPLLATGSDLLKPDVAAPGVAVLAGVSPIGTGGDNFGFLSGTSMASPHIAGVGALILAENPKWSPATVKSAIMTTADPVKTADGGVDGDVFATGAGQVDPASVLSPGLVYDAGVREYLQFVEGTGYDDVDGLEGIEAKDMNVPSFALGNLTGAVTVTRTVTALTPGLYQATANVPGVNVTVTPSVLNFDAAGETRTFEVTFENVGAPLGEFAKGSLVWEGQGKVVASPVAVRPQSVIAPSEVSFTSEGPDGSGVIDVTSGANGPVNMTLLGLSKANSEEFSLVPNGGDSLEDPASTYTTQVTVPADTPFAKMSVLSSDSAADFDMYILDPAGGQHIVATASASETLSLADPLPGTYTVFINLYASPEERATAATFDAAILGAAEGNATLSPNPIELGNGESGQVTLNWTGLEPGSYVGRVTYEGSTAVTFVSVVVDESGDASATAVPEANEADKLPSGPSEFPTPTNNK